MLTAVPTVEVWLPGLLTASGLGPLLNSVVLDVGRHERRLQGSDSYAAMR